MNPELSIIIPTLNEAETLPGLLTDLAAQSGVTAEILISDGVSGDGTREVATVSMARHGLAGQVLTGAAGRGRQLNSGAARARGAWLLFLHADSRLPDPRALADGLAILRREANPRLAGRFTLQFDPPDAEPAFGYYFCAAKARLDLPGTIHGDQGFLLSAGFFSELGGFREDLPVLEDALLAEAVRARGAWRLLPATIVTSSRRFQSEGFRARQILNALLMNFAAIGWNAPLQRTPEIYRDQNRTRPLDLAPFMRLIDGCLAELPVQERARIWYRTGGYVRGNAWQLMLRRPARRAFIAGLPPIAVPLEPVLRFRRGFDALTDHPPGRLAAALLTWLWFRSCHRQPVQGE